jgi:predicted alpha/beta hydrolase
MSHREITIPSSRAAIACHWYLSLKQHGSVVFVGGAGGGWDTPARGLYPRLAHQLQQQGLACLRVRFRNSLELDEAVHDVVRGVIFLEMQGSTEFGFVGHSFGGAVVILRRRRRRRHERS